MRIRNLLIHKVTRNVPPELSSGPLFPDSDAQNRDRDVGPLSRLSCGHLV